MKLTPVQSGFLEHFGAIDQAAREGGRLPDAWHAKPGIQTDHPHMTALAVAGDRVISEENRNILKGKADALRSAIEAWKQLKREGDNPRGIREELERVADEASNLAKHLQILGVVDGLFGGLGNLKAEPGRLVAKAVLPYAAFGGFDSRAGYLFQSSYSEPELLMKQPVFEADQIGLTSGTYKLPCGCAIYVHFPGGTIHFSHGGGKCAELTRMWEEYMKLCAHDHSWDSLTAYIECLRHVGAWEGRIRAIEEMRAKYPMPADCHDYPE